MGAPPPEPETPPPPPPSASSPPPPKGELDIGGWISKGFAELNSDVDGYIILVLVVMVVSGVTFGILAGPLLAGSYRVIRRKLRGQGKLDIGAVFNEGFSVFVPSFLIVLIPGLIVGILGAIPYIGWIVGLVAGPLLLPFWSFSMHYILEEKQDFVPAGQASWEIIKTNPFNFWVLGLLTGIIMSIGSIACGIGILYTYPVGLIIMSFMLDSFVPVRS